jgi:RNA polymerase sigma-70 factor (ECF subfamily)
MAEAPEEFAGLLARARRKDGGAVAALVRCYESKVRIVARVLLGTALRPYLDSMDLVQSVHGSVLVGLRDGKFDISTREKLEALALTMLRRKLARKWRRARRQRRLDGAAGGPPDLPGLLLSLESAEADPARAALLADTIRHLLARLDPTDRRILEMRSGGYGDAEIAAGLGLTPVAVRVRLSRLREYLRANGLFDDWL